ncbi:MAG: hypothetical protein ACD_63C00135G0001 [uncultured bacterium]|nr:MAG: hypothetical protein ACD_63C00135G0001 [uncultured bacterium]
MEKKIVSKNDDVKEKTDKSKSLADPDKEKSKKVEAGKVIGVVVAVIIIVAIAFIVVLGLGIYKKRWDKKYSGNRIFDKIITYIPYPVIFVDSNVVALKEYDDNIAAMKHFFEKQLSVDLTTEDGKKALLEVEMRVKEKLKQEKLIENLLKEQEIVISDEDIEKEYQAYISQEVIGGEENALKMFDQQFGWGTKEELMKFAIKPYLARTKLEEKLKENDEYKSVAKKKVEKVLAEVREKPDSFAEFARKYSDDPQSAQTGGELGFFGKGMMLPAFEEAAFALKKDEISNLVETEFGYHIIKMNDRDDKNEQVNVSHILFAFFESWLKEEEGQAKISIWL